MATIEEKINIVNEYHEELGKDIFVQLGGFQDDKELIILSSDYFLMWDAFSEFKSTYGASINIDKYLFP